MKRGQDGDIIYRKCIRSRKEKMIVKVKIKGRAEQSREKKSRRSQKLKNL